MSIPTPEYVRAETVQKLLRGCCRKTVTNYQKRGLIPSPIKVNKRALYPLRDTLLAAHRNQLNMSQEAVDLFAKLQEQGR